MITEPRVHRWTRDEYYRLGKAGLLAGMNVELIEGQVVEMTPISRQHAAAVTLLMPGPAHPTGGPAHAARLR